MVNNYTDVLWLVTQNQGSSNIVTHVSKYFCMKTEGVRAPKQNNESASAVYNDREAPKHWCREAICYFITKQRAHWTIKSNFTGLKAMDLPQQDRNGNINRLVSYTSRTGMSIVSRGLTELRCTLHHSTETVVTIAIMSRSIQLWANTGVIDEHYNGRGRG